MLNTATAILDAVAGSFPSQNIKLAFQVTAEALDGTKTALAKAVLAYGYAHYPGRFYAQLDILRGLSPRSCAAPCNLDAAGENNNPLSLFKLLRDHQYAEGMTGIQDVAGVVNGPVDDCRQNGQHPCYPCDVPPAQYSDVLQTTVNVALSYTPAFFEVWNGDAKTQTGAANSCPITNPGKAAMRQVFSNTTSAMGGTPRP
jgi:hypothetical protein